MRRGQLRCTPPPLVVVRPHFATNLETPRAIGCSVTHIDLAYERGFQHDLAAVEQAITPAMRLISVTCPHNPTGTMLTWDELMQLEQMAEHHDYLLLVDETYRDLTYGTPSPTAASLVPRVIAVSSLSKAFGTPGLRLAWLLNRNPELMERFLAAKEPIGICGSVVDERPGVAVLEERDVWLPRRRVTNLRHLQIVRDWISAEPLMEWIEPRGGAVCFPRIRMRQELNVDRFYRALLETHGTYVGPSHWFEMPKWTMRIGFAWPLESQLRDGLTGISTALREQDSHNSRSWTYHASSRCRAHGIFYRKVRLDLTLGLREKHRTGICSPSPGQP